MEFLAYHRDRPGSMPLRDALIEAHWSYMDGFAEQLIARGPTFDEATEACTGSVHIVDLPDPAAARAFAFDEPNYQAGAYRDVLLRRWRNTLGRTMWDHPGLLTEEAPRTLVLAFGEGAPADLTPPPTHTPHLIAYGPLLADDGTTWLGTAAILDTPTPTTAHTLLTPTAYATIETHPWAPGGRR
ncbi:YciI family protein [Kitasatospora sp. NPDC051170]|uniref:YciI family protein n=1 Tax=Kitasatospora sp. NPDC051170 TaxID=3364056 RepID=UPI0037BBA81B